MTKLLFFIGVLALVVGFLFTPNESVRTNIFFYIFIISWILGFLSLLKKVK